MKMKKIICSAILMTTLGNISTGAACDPCHNSDNYVVECSLPVFIGSAVVAPFLAGYGNQSPDVALASAIFNTATIVLPFFNARISAKMEGGGHGQTCGMVPCASLIRNALCFGLNIGASAMAWKYYLDGNDTFNAVNITLTSISSITTIVGTSVMFGCLYKGYSEKYTSSEQRRLY